MKIFQRARVSGLLRTLGIKTPLSKIPLIRPHFFEEYKMNDTLNKYLLAGDFRRFMPEMHLRQQPGFTYSACEPFTKNKERIQKFLRNREFTIYLSKGTR